MGGEDSTVRVRGYRMLESLDRGEEPPWGDDEVALAIEPPRPSRGKVPEPTEDREAKASEFLTVNGLAERLNEGGLRITEKGRAAMEGLRAKPGETTGLFPSFSLMDSFGKFKGDLARARKGPGFTSKAREAVRGELLHVTGEIRALLARAKPDPKLFSEIEAELIRLERELGRDADDGFDGQPARKRRWEPDPVYGPEDAMVDAIIYIDWHAVAHILAALLDLLGRVDWGAVAESGKLVLHILEAILKILSALG